MILILPDMEGTINKICDTLSCLFSNQKSKEFPEERKYITELVNRYPVVVFSKSKCPHCYEAKCCLDNKGVGFVTVELDTMPAVKGAVVQGVLSEMTDAGTVPRIFIDGTCVGGNTDLQTLNRTGKLDHMLMERQKPEEQEEPHVDFWHPILM